MSELEKQEIMNRVNGMSEEQIRTALVMVPYRFLFDELVYRYEALLKHYSKNAAEVAAMGDILPQ